MVAAPAVEVTLDSPQARHGQDYDTAQYTFAQALSFFF